MIKPLLNDVQKAKINIFKESQVAQGLRKIINEDQIPDVYGGTDPNPIGQSPPEVELHQHAMKGLRDANQPMYTDSAMVHEGNGYSFNMVPREILNPDA